MKNLTRSTRLAVVPAVFAALALSACQDEAPSAAPPSPASPTAAQSDSGGGDAPTSEGTQEQPAEPSTAAPETSEAPSTDSGSGGGSGGGSGACNNTSSFAFKKGSASAKAQDATQTATYKSSGGTAEISFGKPKVDKSGGNSFFPGDGYETVVYPVTIKMTGGSYFIATRLAFGLVDGSDNSCKSDVLNAVVPKGDEVPVESMKPGDSMTKKLGFAVPAGADLKDYSLVFASDYSSGTAELAWKGE